MKLQKFPLQAKQSIAPGDRLEGYIEMPEGARIVHVGAVPPSGEMLAFAEVGDVEVPHRKRDVIVLKAGDPIPRGHRYLAHILANPLLFVYEREEKAIIARD